MSFPRAALYLRGFLILVYFSNFSCKTFNLKKIQEVEFSLGDVLLFVGAKRGATIWSFFWREINFWSEKLKCKGVGLLFWCVIMY